jgi:hypothetical protein
LRIAKLRMKLQMANLNRPTPGLMPVHGGYRHLKSFQVAQLAYMT